MMAAVDQLVDFVTWLLLSSLKATIIIALIVIAQIIFRKHLSAQWKHALWFLLIVRLLIPIDISMPWSIYNLTKKIETDLPLGFSQRETTQVVRSATSAGTMYASASPYLPVIKADVRSIPES